MKRNLAGVAIGLFVLLQALPAISGQVEGDVANVQVMFDFGEGTVLWQDVGLTDNRTAILATERAAQLLGLTVEVQWFSFGAFVADIGDRNPVFPVWWHFLRWDESNVAWALAPVGASDLLLETGDIIGWFLTESWPETVPQATPSHPYPATSFRGDRANTGFTPASPPEIPALAWRFDFGGHEIGASPIGANGIIYQVTWNGTHAIDMDSRELLWRADAAAGLSTPSLLGGDLIVGSRDGSLYRLDGGTGDIIWSTLLQDGAQFTGIASSPKVHANRVYVGTFNESGGQGHLYSVNVTSGAVVWSAETGSIHMSSPALHAASVYIGVMGHYDPTPDWPAGGGSHWSPPYGLLSVNISDGTVRWFFETDGPVASSPAVAEGTVYFTSRDGYLYGVTVEGSMAFKEEIGPSTSSPAVRGDLIYAASGSLTAPEGRVVAFDKGLGKLWEFTTNGPVQGSVTLTADLVLVATNVWEGTVYALDVMDGSVVWSFTPQPSQHILATPVVMDGVVLIPSDGGFLFALGEGSPDSTLDMVLVYTLVGVGAAAVIIGVAVLLWRRKS